MSEISKRLDRLKELADDRVFPDVKARRAVLRCFRAALISHRDAIIEALQSDLNKCPFETLSGELLGVLGILGFLEKKLPKLAAPRRRKVSPINFPASGCLLPEPYGAVLVVSTWNYPLSLALEPLLGAYAAGNRVVVKLPARARRTTALLRWLIEKTFPLDEVVVVSDEMHLKELLERPFDYIFLTGSATAGKLALRAAAEHFTPVTLELGGKSPCIVDHTADLKRAALKIAWGKFSNAGQTCVAPDYLLVEESVCGELVRQLGIAIRQMYGENPLKSPDCGSIIDASGYERLSKMLSHGRLLYGGEKDPASLRIAPTVIDQLDAADPLLKEEIFGPLLPVITFENEEELVARLPKLPKPLALYYFGNDKRKMKFLRESTSSGALVFNDVVTHFLNFHLPFGGVGASGMGCYHGRQTFETFTHLKPVMKQSRFWDFSFRYPPYGKLRMKLMKFLTKF
ncbi:MAG: aldehyde dehydrogenase family protein [Victivallaceae bacterium]|nr:aldehyde dehydrogenase family protein [Victivallaceae bacterium]